MFSRTVKIFAIKLLGASFPLALSFIAANSVGTAVLGALTTGITIALFAGTFCAFGQNVPLMRADKELLGPQYNASLCIAAINLCLTLPVAYSAFTVVFEEAAFLLAALVLLFTLLQVQAPILTRNGYFSLNAALNAILRNSFPVCFISLSLLLSVILGSESAYRESSVFTAGLVVSLVIWSLVYTSRLARTSCRPAVGVRSLLQGYISGRYSVVISMLAIGLSQFDRLYVFALMGAAQAGIYFTAQAMVFGINYLNQAIVMRISPSLVQNYTAGSSAEVAEITRRFSRVSVGFSCIYLAAFMMFHAPIARFFSIDSYVLVSIVATLICAHIVSLVFGYGATIMQYDSQRMRKSYLQVLCASTFIAGTISILLIPYLGIFGAAVGGGSGLIINRFIPFMIYRARGVDVGIFKRHRGADGGL